MRRLLVILFLLGSFVAHAQQHAFLVYSVTGNVQVNIAGKTAAAQKGQWLDGKEKITLAKNAQVTLVCQSYKPVVISKKGTYALSSFKDSCSHDESFSTAYFHYVWEEFSHAHKSVEDDRHHYMKNYGAAVRGNCVHTVENRLNVINYYKGSFYLKWDGKDAALATLEVYDGDKKVASIVPGRDGYSLDSIASKISGYGQFYWSIKPKGQNECARRELNLVQGKAFDVLSIGLTSTAAAVTRDKAEQYFMLAFMYEERHYFANAWQYYKKAVASDPGQAKYKATLSSFETQYGLAGR